MAAYKVGAEAGDALSQHQVGFMYSEGHGVAVDYQQARRWLEKAAAQDQPSAVSQLALLYFEGKGVTPSWRRARELWERAIGLGHSKAVGDLQELNEEDIPMVRPAAPRSSSQPSSTHSGRCAMKETA